MKKMPLCKLDLDLYYEKLDNGLEVYLIPNSKVHNKYVTFSTKYGSVDNEFIPISKSKMTKVPEGIAHFLEHKLFEQESGEDPFTFFGERGADANANTSNYKTTYLFSGTDFLEENLNFLLDYVQSPYFTDENVLKEQGIIDQEISMYQDKPYSRLWEELVYHSFVKHPIRYSVIGTSKSIHSITKEDLYLCYNTFYHPENMFVVVVGDFKVEPILDVISKNQEKKEFPPFKEIVRKKYKEPNTVCKEYVEVKMKNVKFPKVSIGYKIPKGNFGFIEEHILLMYLNILFDSLFGNTSLINETLKKEEIIYEDFSMSTLQTDEHILYVLSIETNYPKKLLKRVEETLSTIHITEEEFARKKKVYISDIIKSSDNIYRLNDGIMSQIIQYGEVKTNFMEDIHNLSMDKMEEVIKKLDLKNRCVCVAKSDE